MSPRSGARSSRRDDVEARLKERNVTPANGGFKPPLPPAAFFMPHGARNHEHESASGRRNSVTHAEISRICNADAAQKRRFADSDAGPARSIAKRVVAVPPRRAQSGICSRRSSFPISPDQRCPPGQVSSGMLTTTPGLSMVISPLPAAFLTSSARLSSRALRSSFQVTRLSSRSGL